MENGLIYSFLNMTARQMDTPEMFGAFHLTALLITAALAVLAAFVFSHHTISPESDPAAPLHAERPLSGSREDHLQRILCVTGWILVLLEIYKQLFLYYIVNGGAYDWWYFPFQLCSVPMYLCILMPFVRDRLRSTFLTFMSGYTFVSAVAALIYPEDFLRPYVSLTLHGFAWHGLLLFISLVIMFSGAADDSIKGLLRSAGLFAVTCIIAAIINIAAEPSMQTIRAEHPAVVHNYAAMFYLNPYHISPQPIVSSIQKTAGIPAGLILYAIVIAAVSSLIIIAKKNRSG